MNMGIEVKKNKQKILPVKKPVITTYTQHAHLLSILTQYTQTYPWIYSNYIQLYINKDYKVKWGDFYFPMPYEIRTPEICKWLETQKINRRLIERAWNRITDFVEECIDADNYLHTMINYFYIPVSDRYQTRNLNHDIFIYGYDKSKQELYVSDFFNGGKYSNETISYSDFLQAYSNYYNADNEDYLHQMVYLYRYNENCDYQFTVQNIIESIKLYLSGEAPEYWKLYNNDNRGQVVYGRNVYTALKNYAFHLKEGVEKFDVRAFYMIYDHKKLMTLRLMFLKEQGYFTEINNDRNIKIAGEVEEKAMDMVNMGIKYYYTQNNREADKIIDLLEEIERKEYDILRQYIQ